MNTNDLVEWQKIDSNNGFVMPWWTHPFLDELQTWNLSGVRWLEFGAGRSTAWLRTKCRWVNSIEASNEWAQQALTDCTGLLNGIMCYRSNNLREGVEEDLKPYMELIPTNEYDIISVDGIFRNECLQFAIDHFKGRGGILIADNFDQDFVWISPAAEKMMEPYKSTEKIFYQPNHVNHEGRQWNTRYWIIPK